MILTFLRAEKMSNPPLPDRFDRVVSSGVISANTSFASTAYTGDTPLSDLSLAVLSAAGNATAINGSRMKTIQVVNW